MNHEKTRKSSKSFQGHPWCILPNVWFSVPMCPYLISTLTHYRLSLQSQKIIFFTTENGSKCNAVGFAAPSRKTGIFPALLVCVGNLRTFNGSLWGGNSSPNSSHYPVYDYFPIAACLILFYSLHIL